MIHHDSRPVSNNTEPSTKFELDYGLLLKELAELENQKVYYKHPSHSCSLHFTSSKRCLLM